MSSFHNLRTFLLKTILSFVGVVAFYALEANHQSGILFAAAWGLVVITLNPKATLYPLILLMLSVIGAASRQEVVVFLAIIAMSCELVERLYMKSSGNDVNKADSAEAVQTPAEILVEICEEDKQTVQEVVVPEDPPISGKDRLKAARELARLEEQERINNKERQLRSKAQEVKIDPVRSILTNQSPEPQAPLSPSRLSPKPRSNYKDLVAKAQEKVRLEEQARATQRERELRGLDKK